MQQITARGLSIDVLINNAGLGGAGPFASSEPERVSEMLQVNIVALTELTRFLLPGMVARGRGRILRGRRRERLAPHRRPPAADDEPGRGRPHRLPRARYRPPPGGRR